MPDAIYEEIEPLDRDEINTAVQRNRPSELLYVVLSVALHEADHEFAESFCLGFTNHSHFNVRGNAILGLAHIARIHGILNERRVKPVIAAALLDKNEYVRGQAEGAMEDTEFYLNWKYTDR